MRGSRYCEDCEENWPNEIGYAKCPGCGEPTTTAPSIPPMGVLEARQHAIDLGVARDRRTAFLKCCAENPTPAVEAEVAEFKRQLDAFTGVPA